MMPRGYRRRARQDHLDFCSFAGRAIEIESAPQTIGHDVVDDVQPKAGAAEITARREERIEGLVPDVGAHPATIVAEKDLDFVFTRRPHLDIDRSALVIGKRNA
jgi:hypothetical protein